MQDRSVVHSTIVIERSYKAAPERVFAAFADPNKKRRWFAEGEGFQVEQFETDFRVGGRELVRFRAGKDAPVKGAVFTNETTYQDIVPNQHVVLAYTMAQGEKRISASLATFEFLPKDSGTDLVFTEQAAFFEGADGPQMREGGWRQLLARLDTEVSER